MTRIGIRRIGPVPPNSFPHFFFFFFFIPFHSRGWWAIVGCATCGHNSPTQHRCFVCFSSYPSVELVVAHQNKRGHVGGGHVPLEDLSVKDDAILDCEGVEGPDSLSLELDDDGALEDAVVLETGSNGLGFAAACNGVAGTGSSAAPGDGAPAATSASAGFGAPASPCEGSPPASLAGPGDGASAAASAAVGDSTPVDGASAAAVDDSAEVELVEALAAKRPRVLGTQRIPGEVVDPDHPTWCVFTWVSTSSVKCSLCRSDLSVSEVLNNSTGNARRHLDMHGTQNATSIRPIDRFFQPAQVTDRTRRIRERIARYVAACSLPLRTVEEPTFRAMLAEVGEFKPYSRSTLRADVIAASERIASAMAARIASFTRDPMSLQIDLWTSKDVRTYLGMVLSVADEELRVHHFPLPLVRIHCSEYPRVFFQAWMSAPACRTELCCAVSVGTPRTVRAAGTICPSPVRCSARCT